MCGWRRWVEKGVLAGFTESKIPTKLEDAGGTSWRAIEGAEGGAGSRQSEKAE